MTELSRGIYEHLITSELADRLRLIGPELVERTALDPADAHEVLARHIAALTRRALRAVSGSDDESLARQVAVANQIAETIALIEPRARRRRRPGDRRPQAAHRDRGPASATGQADVLVPGRSRPPDRGQERPLQWMPHRPIRRVQGPSWSARSRQRRPAINNRSQKTR